MNRRPPSRLRLFAKPADAGVPLDRFVADRGGIPLDAARAAIARGGAFVSGKRVREGSSLLHGGETVEMSLRADPATPVLGEERVLSCDEHVLGLDKPAGVLAQEGRAGGPSLLDLAAELLRTRNQPATVLLVHRLDRGTTGATVLARTKEAQEALLAEFREGRVEKEYLALCAGDPRDDEGVIDVTLGPDRAVPGKRRVDPSGEPAQTRYRVLERLRGGALVAAFPLTGRTHQVRVHLASVGLPLAGDARYGGPRFLAGEQGARLELLRPLLHSSSLRVRHPVSGVVSLVAQVPPDLREAARFLRTGSH
ncbi:MAG: RluA family pseudouridine synthase [Myxococcales bacterium]